MTNNVPYSICVSWLEYPGHPIINGSIASHPGWTSKMQGYFPIAVENNGLFGYQKMTYALNNNSDVKYNCKRIYRIMAVNGIESHFRIGRRHSNYRKQRITYWIGISMPKHRI